MFEVQLYAKDSQGTLVPVITNVDGKTIVVSELSGIARTTNPTATSDGERVNSSFDKLGRQLVIPYQVRDLVSTARATASTGAETTLFAGAASTFHDMVYVRAANTSTAAVAISIRDATGGGVVSSIVVPASDTHSSLYTVPLPQNAAGDTWTFQNTGTDVSNTTIEVSALFLKNL